MHTPPSTLFETAIRLHDQELLKYISKIVAIIVRNNMEDFHVKHLSDTQMAELNPLIRNGIYDALFALSLSGMNTFGSDFIKQAIRCIPSYWEEPVLSERLAAIAQNMKPVKENPIQFNSPFLNAEYQNGNIYEGPTTGMISIKGSYEFVLEDGINAHRHRDKISAALRKEGYMYVASLMAYIRRSEI
ncbi:MAG: hypothetical protein MUC87_00010 [Bacteroidia bacterium]|jgi:hypothetical protein|nr:hypothetical protein [Bacteroidia bacterium]